MINFSIISLTIHLHTLECMKKLMLQNTCQMF